MRVFLDIGSHTGESVHEVRKPQYSFDRIVCFEPVKSCLPQLERLRAEDPRIQICPFGLSDKTGTVELHHAGELGGSVFATGGRSEFIELVDAADWFENNINPGDLVVVKTNCEGSEVDIVNRLLDRGLMALAYTFLITFDIRDYPKLRHKEVEVRKRLKASGLTNYCFSDDVMIGTSHDKRLAHWLSLYGVNQGASSREDLQREFRGNFRRFSAKSGRLQRLELKAKELLGYGAMPEPVKALLRTVKRTAGLSRERDS